MRYLTIYRPTSGQEGGMPTPEHMAEMGKLIEAFTKSGALIAHIGADGLVLDGGPRADTK